MQLIGFISGNMIENPRVGGSIPPPAPFLQRKTEHAGEAIDFAGFVIRLTGGLPYKSPYSIGSVPNGFRPRRFIRRAAAAGLP
ncbi:hypothetical protein [Leisingera sp. JC11]|uniref:hypothetical protein n=1 Tax=Leisingera sp. JC11 TaxID=3042469 RepID=UPI003453D105